MRHAYDSIKQIDSEVVCETTDLDNTPFRAAFLGLSERQTSPASFLARELGWYRSWPAGDGYPDTDRVRKVLGLKSEYSRGKAYTRKKVRRKTAMKLLAPLGLDPADVGL